MINKTLEILFDEELELLKEVFNDTLENNNYLERYNRLSNLDQITLCNILMKLKNKLKTQIQEAKKIIRLEKKVITFYKIFFYEGYTIEEIEFVLNNKIALNLVQEYLKRGTPQERRAEIISIILKELNNEYTTNLATRNNKPDLNVLKLSPTYNRIVSNIKAKSA